LLPVTNITAFQRAVKQFDNVERHKEQWRNLAEQPGQELVLLHGETKKIYPIKFMLSLAGGVAEGTIGDEEAVRFFGDKSGWKVSVVKADNYLSAQNQDTSPTIKFIEAAELYEPRLLQTCIKRFTEGQHKSFSSDYYLQQERDYKLRIVERLPQELGERKMALLLEQGRFNEAATLIRRFPNNPNDNLLYYPYEAFPLQNAPDEALARAFYDLLYGADVFPNRFQAWIKVLNKHSHLCWPAATYYLMIHDPEKHIYVKPGTLGKLINAVSTKFKWQPRTSAAYYVEVQRFSQAILEELKPYGARDMLDVQSFAWILRDYQ
jgi:hypothetical protein